MAVSRTDLRQDSEKYVEGVEKGDIINLKLYKGSILEPGTTFTSATLNDAGMLEIPVVKTTTEQTATGICEKGNYSEVDVDVVDVKINEKVSEKYNGCFVTAGLADNEFRKGIDNQKTNNMKKSFERHFNTLITDPANSTAGTVIDTKTAWDKLLGEQTAFYERTGEMPTAVYVSAKFAQRIISEKINRPTAEGDKTLMKGVIGEVLEMKIIRNPFLTTTDFVMLGAEGIYIADPKNTAQIATANMIAGNSPLTEFSKGILLVEHTDPDTGIVMTKAHKFFGMKVINKDYITISGTDTKKS